MCVLYVFIEYLCNQACHYSPSNPLFRLDQVDQIVHLNQVPQMSQQNQVNLAPDIRTHPAYLSDPDILNRTIFYIYHTDILYQCHILTIVRYNYSFRYSNWVDESSSCKISHLYFQAFLSDLGLLLHLATQKYRLLLDQSHLEVHHILCHLMLPIKGQMNNFHMWFVFALQHILNGSKMKSDLPEVSRKQTACLCYAT